MFIADAEVDSKLKPLLVDSMQPDGTILETARQVVALSKAGLANRNVQDGMGSDETIFLDVIEEVAESGKTRAERLLERFHGPWGGNIDKVFEECAY